MIRQKQEGYSIATITTVLGDLTATQLRLIGDLALAFGDGAVRVTADQNVVLRWIRATDLEALYRRLTAASLARAGAGTLADVTSCPGAESCRLAVTQSRGLARLLVDGLEQRPDIVEAAAGLNIKISGCPNGCGQHHIAGLGFQGSLRKVGGRPAPHYFVMIGGGSDEQGTTFGRRVATVPARRSLEVVERLTHLYRTQKVDEETPLTFFRRVDLALVKSKLADLEVLSAETAPADDVRRPCREPGVRAGSHGRGMQRMSGVFTPRGQDVASVVDLIGHTPLLRLGRFTADTPEVEILAKAEFLNPGGSVKDRAAAAIIREAERQGHLRPGTTILDATSGNTGIAYAMIAAARGYRLTLCVPDNVTVERKRTLRAYGAELILTDPMEGTDGAIREARRRQAAESRPVLLRRSVQQRRQLARAFRDDGDRDSRADRRKGDAFRRRTGHEWDLRRRRPPTQGIQPARAPRVGPAGFALERHRGPQAHGDGDPAWNLRFQRWPTKTSASRPSGRMR